MFFLFQVIVVVVGATLHVLFDRKPERRSRRRVVELYLVWLMAGGGVTAIVAGLGHTGPYSAEVAEGIGYRRSMFQWEIGWADIAIGVLGLGCIWKRGSWMTAAVTVLAISYWGDAIGHIVQYITHDNTAPENVWAIPSDLIQPALAIALLVTYRLLSREELSSDTTGEPTNTETSVLAEVAVGLGDRPGFSAHTDPEGVGG